MSHILIRSIIEFALIILFIIGLKNEAFLIKFEHACYIHLKNYIRRKKNENMSIKCPCKNCIERTVNCHSTCENYISFKNEWNEWQQKIRETKEKEYGYWASKHERNKTPGKFLTKTEK